LLAKAVDQPMNLLTDTLHSRASPLPHLDLHFSDRQWSALALALALALAFDLAFDLDLKRPVKPRWPNAGLNPWVTRQDAGLAALGQGWPIAAAHGFKPERGHTEPRRGAEWWGEAFCLLLRFSKVSRCKSGTNSRRYPNNGYVHRRTAIAGKPAPTFELHFSRASVVADEVTDTSPTAGR